MMSDSARKFERANSLNVGSPPHRSAAHVVEGVQASLLELNGTSYFLDQRQRAQPREQRG